MTAYVFTGIPVGAAVTVYRHDDAVAYPGGQPHGPVVASGTADVTGTYTVNLPYSEHYHASWGGAGAAWAAPDLPTPPSGADLSLVDNGDGAFTFTST